MKNILKNNTIITILCIVFSMGFASCSDWTDTESVDVNRPNAGDVDPAVYAKYLEAIRAYKLQDHKLMYAWYDNFHGTPQNRSQHITALPDSVDVISLMNPDNLSDLELKEIEKVRNDKGMKVVFDVDYAAFVKEYQTVLGISGVFVDSVFVKDYLEPGVKKSLDLVNKYNYDGIIFSYQGKSTIHMPSAQVLKYTTSQNAFLNPIKAWHTANPSKLLIFEGKPENLLDNTILTTCKNIIINGMDQTSALSIAAKVQEALVAGVPTDRFIFKVSATSLNAEEASVGYFSNGDLASKATAEWVSNSASNYTKAGMGIYNVQNDFFNPMLTYWNTRKAINILNPSF